MLRAKPLGQALRVVADQGRSGRDDAGRAPPVDAKRDRPRLGKSPKESFEARPRCSPEAVDRLVVVANDERITSGRQQLDKALLGEVEILVLIDEHVWKAACIAPEHRRILLEHPHSQQQQVVEIEQPLLAAFPLVSTKEPDACAHQLGALGLIARRGPPGDPFDGNELLLHALEHLEDWRDEVIGSLVPDQGGVADLPHQLAGEDPALGPRQDPKAGQDTDRAPVLAQPAEGDRVERAHPGSRGVDQILDPLSHLPRGALGEGHDQHLF